MGLDPKTIVEIITGLASMSSLISYYVISKGKLNPKGFRYNLWILINCLVCIPYAIHQDLWVPRVLIFLWCFVSIKETLNAINQNIK